MSRNDEILAEKRNTLARLEAGYIHAQKYLKSEQFTEAKLSALEKIQKLMKATFLQEAEANFIIGRLVQIIDDLEAPQKAVTLYESEKKSIADMLGKLGG